MILPSYATGKTANERFLDLASIVGGDIALYCFCAVYNLPLDITQPAEDWETYCEKLEKLKGVPGFIDGEVDIEVVLENSQTEMYRWRLVWGEGNPDNPYTPQDYRFLDALFKTYSARLEAGGGMDAQQEDTLRDCCKSRLLADKSRALGTKEGVEIYTKLNKTIQDNLSSENLRRKDAKPIETARVDGIIAALQGKYGVGMELSKEQACEIFFKWTKSRGYPETLDAAEQALMAIINTTRANNDLPELLERPKEVRALENYQSEFAIIPNEMEDEAYKYLGMKHGDEAKGVV